MKKVFRFSAPGKADARVVEGVKSELRKYVQRERRKTLPEGFDVWTFACRVGATEATAAPCQVPDLSAAIDAVVRSGGTEAYVEIVATPGHRVPRATTPADAPAPDAGT